MSRFVYAFFGLILATQLLAQTAKPVAAKGTPTDGPRINKIWEFADARIVKEQDEWFSDGDFPRAVALIGLQIQYDPDNDDIVSNMGWMLGNMKQDSQMISLYEDYLKRFPSNSAIAIMLASHYVNKKQYSRSIVILEKCVGLGAEINVYRLLARTYEREKNFKDSLRVYLALAAKWPNDAPTKNNIKRLKQRNSGGK